jgi:molybdopterin-containing oxidoreductase family membrane subunit
MPRERHIMGLFKDENQVVSAINALKQSSYKFIRVNTPIPSHKILDVLQLKKSRVGWFTLCGGILGFIGGFALAIFTATRWNLIVSGKPIVAIIPFVVVGFEVTILGAVFGNVIGLLSQMRLPSFRWFQHYDERCSGEHFGVLAACEPMQENGLKEFFQEQGAEVRVFETIKESPQL